MYWSSSLTLCLDGGNGQYTKKYGIVLTACIKTITRPIWVHTCEVLPHKSITGGNTSSKIWLVPWNFFHLTFLREGERRIIGWKILSYGTYEWDLYVSTPVRKVSPLLIRIKGWSPFMRLPREGSHFISRPLKYHTLREGDSYRSCDCFESVCRWLFWHFFLIFKKGQKKMSEQPVLVFSSLRGKEINTQKKHSTFLIGWYRMELFFLYPSRIQKKISKHTIRFSGA